MGLISREPTAPIADTETASGAEVEAEFNKLFNEFNGNLDADNFAAAAALGTTKLKDETIQGLKFKNASLTTAQMASAAQVSTDATGDTMTTEWLAFQDVPSISSIFSTSIVRYTLPRASTYSAFTGRNVCLSIHRV